MSELSRILISNQDFGDLRIVENFPIISGLDSSMLVESLIQQTLRIIGENNE